jgi:hypothetical protein
LSKTDDLLKLIGIGAIGIMGIGLVLFILTAMCVLVAVFAYQAQPGSPAVTISPVEGPSTIPAADLSGTVLFDETKTIPKGYYQFYSMILKPGMSIDVSVATNGSPVDVLVMDSINYGKYVAAINSIRGGSWQDHLSEKLVIDKSFKFTAPGTDRYFIILDNTGSPEGGADADEDVDVHMTITYP